MAPINSLFSYTTLLRRDDAPTVGGLSPALMDGMIALLVILFVVLLAVVALLALRRNRQRRAQAAAADRDALPTHRHHKHSHSRLTITTRSSKVYVYGEKRSSASLRSPSSAASSSPPSPAVPEIRITFPDEQDESGRRRSGRVVVVRVGERSIGLEPLDDEQLPAYEKESSQPFHAIDMDRIGGLKEKQEWA